jgi:hypothetical protein
MLGRVTNAREVIGAIAFLPLTAVVGGRAAFGDSVFASSLLGLAFWPAWLLLARQWLKRGPSLWLGLALGLWMLVGFAQPVARFGLIMSA